jgi:hypothetical protein
LKSNLIKETPNISTVQQPVAVPAPPVAEKEAAQPPIQKVPQSRKKERIGSNTKKERLKA